ncbi:universal stress protein [Roseicyclus mahoneyensis]|uniref:Nucleotide-binding universal stress UspA family protein n=1 Tax=Roseicyclus mahoneyensis TaxID=164332 RepID=A0A316GPF9_9RHOB|nr:universal stress protein [Roseicyclus mahoneyensis]PWK62261.1 nucleotide-binding universal stress UspA family protein [Roseicyclus mahoneyensis]
MAIKSILVAYSGDATSSGGLRLAVQMARKYGAHLTGVVSHGPAFLEREYSRVLSDDLLKIIRSRDIDAVAEIRANFETVVAANGPGIDASFLDLQMRRGFSIAEQARSHDILVMGRRATEPGREHFGEAPEDVAINSGRPVILVQHGYDRDAINEHAVVAWDGSRAAARALGDAMHILETKESVTVLSVGEINRGLPQPQDVVALLQRHGIRADHVARTADRGGVSRTILAACTEMGAGLLVMGAYGHSRTMEDLFGGVTRDVMKDAPLPVLLSH